jgi:hypothetical protein
MKKLLSLLILACVIACTQKKSSNAETQIIKDTMTIAGMVVADTIIYDVIIRNPNMEDQWTESCLKGLKRLELVDTIFSMIYSEKVTALNYDTKETLKVKDIRQLEKEGDFSRGKIGKMQFTERWIFNTNDLSFTKEIISVVLGYEVYDGNGELRGYKPAFLINFNAINE